jgi:site-specific recombinase XerD
MADTSRERLDDLLVSFRRDLRASDKAPRTLELYTATVERFAAFLTARDLPPVLGEFTKAAIGAHLGSRLDAGMTAATVAMDYRGLKRFCRWAVAEDYLPTDPMIGLDKPKPKEHPVPVLTDGEIGQLLKACEGTDFVSRRDLAMIRVLLDCGVRISEVAGLRLEDVDLKSHDVIHVTGKGGKSRAIPFGAKTGKALDRYIRERRNHKAADEPGLWLGQRGAMSVWGVQERLKAIAAEAKVEGLHAHLRRGLARQRGPGARPHAAGRLVVGRHARRVRASHG